MRPLSYLVFATSLLLVSCHSNSASAALATELCHVEGEATCSGDASCKACKNCKYCKKCSQQGGSCGVCK